jgi:pilus assembly protein Flp/PilA
MQKFFADQSGASLVEYGLLVALIAVAAIVAITNVGEAISSLFNDVATRLGTEAADVNP